MYSSSDESERVQRGIEQGNRYTTFPCTPLIKKAAIANLHSLLELHIPTYLYIPAPTTTHVPSWIHL